jgi:hypothetical protein
MFTTSLIMTATPSIAFGAGGQTKTSVRATALTLTPQVSISPVDNM